MMRTERGLTFENLCAIEPRLRELERRVKAVRDDGTASFCANDAWYGLRSWHRRGLRNKMAALVGWGASNPCLRSSEAYDIAHRTLYEALPDCRSCQCVAVDTFLSAVVIERTGRFENAHS